MNIFSVPLPRFKIYPKVPHYFRVVTDMLLGRTNKGNYIERLKSTMATILEVQYVIPLPTARYGLYLSVKAIIKPGQEVIMSPLTIVDVVNMVICAGGIPKFCDTKKQTCNLDESKIEELISSKTGAILVTHLHGLSCDMEKVQSIARKHKIKIIEDSAQALSATIPSLRKYCGTIGDVGVFSFGMYKNVSAFYGGMLVTNDEEIYKIVLEETSNDKPFPISLYLKKFIFAGLTSISTNKYIFSMLTYHVFKTAFLKSYTLINNIVTVDAFPERKNSLPKYYKCTMREVQARLILNQLPIMASNTLKRIGAAKIYFEGLSDLDEIALPPLKIDGSHIYTYFPIMVEERRELLRYALKNNRDWVLSHYHNCADLEIFREFYSACPNARAVSHSLLYLPTYPQYSKKEIVKNINTIRQYYGRASNAKV